MHAYHGHDPRRVPPLILGHEVAGKVVSGAQEGKRAVVNPLVTCGRCSFCDTGRSNLCPQRELIGMRLAGAYAEYVSIPAKNIIPIPDDLSAVHAALTEPTATALHALHIAQRASSRPLAELRALVIGGGAVGLIASLLLQGYGCRQVVVSEINDRRRQSIVEHVKCQVHDPLSDSLPDEGTYELVIDAVGSGITRQTAISALGSGGILVHIGLLDSDGEMDVRKLTLSEIAMLGVYCYTAADMRAAVKALNTGMLGSLQWVETRPLKEGAQAFDDLDKGRTSAAKIVLIP